MKILFISLFLFSLISCAEKISIDTVGSQGLTPAYILQKTNFGIPSEYISDSSFVRMMVTNQTPVKTIYASPTGSGSGTSSSPYSLKDAINALQKGTTLYLKGGTYDLSSNLEIFASGDASNYITISSAPGEKAIITATNGSSRRSVHLFIIAGSYLIIENLYFQDVTCKNAQGIVMYGSGENHIIIRNNVFDSLKTTGSGGDYGANGILLLGDSTNTIHHVIIYGNTVTNNVLGYSEAISIAGNCEEIYVLLNVVKDNTNIGIDFYGNAEYCEDPALDQPRKCVAMYNFISNSNSPYAACAGLYVDGSRNILLSDNTILNSQYGIEVGSEERNDDYPVTNILVKNNLCQDNTKTGIRVGGYNEDETGWVINSIFEGNKILGTDYAVIISKAKDLEFISNDITSGYYFIYMEFTSTYTQNIGFTSNKFTGNGRFKMYATEKLSLDSFISRYPSNIKG